MTELRILSCGPAMTVQDVGRIGAQRYGVSGSGAMDQEAYRAANALVGADHDAAVLEFAAFGGQFKVDEPVLISVTGGSCPIDVDGSRHEPWTSFWLLPDARLSIGSLRDAAYGFVGIGHGIDVPPFMGSRSTHSRSGVGGYQGRPLRLGDVLPVFPSNKCDIAQNVRHPPKQRAGAIRVVAGPQDDYFGEDAWEVLLNEPFTVAAQDRMGMMLEGPVLNHTKGFNIVSDAIAFGSVQVPGSGKPIILLADRQSTGGYPKIATVISCDLGRLAQAIPGSVIRFEKVGVETAEELAIVAHADLLRAIDDLEPVADRPDLSSDRLLGLNLVDGVVNADEGCCDCDQAPNRAVNF